MDDLDVFHIQWAKSLVYYPEFIENLNCPVVLSLRGAHINYSPLGNKNLAQGYIKYFPLINPIWKLIEDPNNISLRHHSLQDIVEGPFFKAIEDSWSCSSIKDGKLKVCANKCGIGFDAFKAQWE